MTRTLAGSAFALAIAVTSVFAQQPQTVRVTGAIAAVDGPTLVIKPREGSDVKVNVADKLAIYGVVKATLADLKPGAYLSIGAMPQPDGSQKAVQVTVFADADRGFNQGHRPWTPRPGGTMTNATVDTTVAGVDGQMLTVKYKDGEKKVIVPPEAVIRRYVVGEKSELKPGASVLITAATKKPDGTLETGRVYVGRDGIVP
jgi:hypothetical protein